jgi:site-specific DNA-methyltransferase (adenine-specific)
MENAKQPEIVIKKITEISPYEKNPRRNDEAVKYVAASIEKFGFKQPIVIDKDGIIVAGHTRYKAAKKLNLKAVPCIVADDLTEEQVKAYRLADNKVAEKSEWDFDLLGEELNGLEGFDMSVFGFEEEEQPEEELEAEEDGYDEEIPEEPRTKPGYIYKLGNHILMCGDSTNSKDVEKLMGGESADLVVTDPPYNVAVHNSKGMTIENDDMDSAQFGEFLTACFGNLERSLKPGGAFYVWYASREHINFEKSLNNAGLKVRQQLVWNKNAFILGRQDYHWKHELCLYGWKDGDSHYFIDDRTQATVFEDKGIDIKKLKKEEMVKLLEEILSDKRSTTVINEDKPTENDLHPTMKPIKLIARLIKNSSRQNEIVLDLFGGSGSTLITCEQLNRRCRMMEYDPRYADVIVDRWEQFTGEKAELIKGDKK